jgi:hypothetical protein
MRVGVRRVALVVAVGAAVACSLTDLSGLSGGETALSPEAGGVDAATDVLVVDASNDVAPPPCKASAQIMTPFTADLGTWTSLAHGQTGYPKVEAFFGSNAGVLFPFVDVTPIPIDAGDPDAGPTFFTPPERVKAISALWQTTPVALRSFDVELDVQVRCTAAGSCADGFAFVWLGTTAASVLSNDNAGGAQGLPSGVDGVAVMLDDYQNEPPEIPNDPPAPSLQVVQLDPALTPGKYPWVVTSRSTPFLGAWHKLGITLRGTSVTVQYDGVVALSTTVKAFTSGLIGLTSGTGGESDAVAVRSFRGSFYDCVP